MLGHVLEFSSTRFEPKRIELNGILVKPLNQTIDQDDIEEIGVKPMSYSQSLVHSAYDSAESIATPPDSDFEDEQLSKMLASQLYIRERWEKEGQARAYHSERESLTIHSSRNPDEARSKCTANTSLSLKTRKLDDKFVSRFPKETEVTNWETVSRVVFILFLDLLTLQMLRNHLLMKARIICFFKQGLNL